jgi:RimJ/RimL family protein N-acetyltransferase
MLKGKSVALRRVEPSDYPDIQRWQNDPEVFYWMDYERPFSLDDIRRSEERATEEGIPFLIEVEGRGIGRTGLNNFRHRDGLASFYLFVGERSVWGKRYGLDALLTVLRYAFEELGLRKVELWMLAGNERAHHLYKTAGFVEEARLPERSFKDGAYVDHVVMSVDRGGYDRASAAAGL